MCEKVKKERNVEQQYHVVPMPIGQVGSDLDYGDGQAGPCMGTHGLCMGGAWFVVYYLDW